MEKREKAANKEAGCGELSRKKSNFCVLCEFQTGNATLITLPIKQTIRGKPCGVLEAGREEKRQVGESKQDEGIVLKETANVQAGREDACTHTHTLKKEGAHHFSAGNCSNITAATQASAGV